MKDKKFEKRLVLNKSTISNLKPESMDRVKGGITDTCFTDGDPTCNDNTWDRTTTNPWTVYLVSAAPLYTRCEICIP